MVDLNKGVAVKLNFKMPGYQVMVTTSCVIAMHPIHYLRLSGYVRIFLDAKIAHPMSV